jgi:hypothetical protein
MVASLASLAVCCVVFGTFPRFFLDTVMAPAAASLLSPGRYAAGVLSGAARLPVLHVPFDCLSAGELATAAASALVAAVAAGGICGSASPRRCRYCGGRTPARSTTARSTRPPGSRR